MNESKKQLFHIKVESSKLSLRDGFSDITSQLSTFEKNFQTDNSETSRLYAELSKMLVK